MSHVTSSTFNRLKEIQSFLYQQESKDHPDADIHKIQNDLFNIAEKVYHASSSHKHDAFFSRKVKLFENELEKTNESLLHLDKRMAFNDRFKLMKTHKKIEEVGTKLNSIGKKTQIPPIGDFKILSFFSPDQFRLIEQLSPNQLLRFRDLLRNFFPEIYRNISSSHESINTLLELIKQKELSHTSPQDMMNGSGLTKDTINFNTTFYHLPSYLRQAITSEYKIAYLMKNPSIFKKQLEAIQKLILFFKSTETEESEQINELSTQISDIFKKLANVSRPHNTSCPARIDETYLQIMLSEDEKYDSLPLRISQAAFRQSYKLLLDAQEKAKASLENRNQIKELQEKVTVLVQESPNWNAFEDNKGKLKDVATSALDKTLSVEEIELLEEILVSLETKEQEWTMFILSELSRLVANKSSLSTMNEHVKKLPPRFCKEFYEKIWELGGKKQGDNQWAEHNLINNVDHFKAALSHIEAYVSKKSPSSSTVKREENKSKEEEVLSFDQLFDRMMKKKISEGKADELEKLHFLLKEKIENKHHFSSNEKEECINMVKDCSAKLRGDIYYKIWEIAGKPQDGDLAWGEHHVGDKPSDWLFKAVDELYSNYLLSTFDQLCMRYEKLKATTENTMPITI